MAAGVVPIHRSGLLSFSQPARAAQEVAAVGVSERSPVSTPIRNTNSIVIGSSPSGAGLCYRIPESVTILDLFRSRWTVCWAWAVQIWAGRASRLGATASHGGRELQGHGRKLKFEVSDVPRLQIRVAGIIILLVFLGEMQP